MRAFAYRGPELAGLAGFYMPKKSEILDVATPGHFYQPTNTETIYGISKRAYGTATPGIYRLNDSLWNSYIRKSTQGWESYAKSGKLPAGNVGIQLEKKYSNNPLRSAHGSGTSRPVLWIPPFDSSEPPEPDDEPKIPYYGPFIPSGPAPETLPPELKPKTPGVKPAEFIPKKKKKKKPADRPKKKRRTVPFDPVPNKKKKKKKPADVRPKKKKKKKPPEVIPADKKKKKKKKPPEVKIVEVQVPVPQPCPHKERNEWSPWLVGGIALALGLVVADNRGRR